MIDDEAHIPPHNLDAEQGVLASVIISDGAIDECINAGITATTFFTVAHQVIYSAMLKLHRDKTGIDEITICEELRTNGTFDNSGGVAYINELSNRIVLSTHLKHWIKIICQREDERRTLTLLRSTEEKIYTGEIQGDQLKKELERFATFQQKIGYSSSIALRDEMKDERILAEKMPPKPNSTFLFKNRVICTPGNLSCITAKGKVGKSSFLSAFVSASFHSFDPCASEIDTLGITAHNEKGGAMIRIDTEQSEWDAYQMHMRQIMRAKKVSAPPWYYSYLLTGQTPKTILAKLKEGIKIGFETYGWIFAIMLDGTADFVKNVNDPEETSDIYSEIRTLSIKWHCPIINVIHSNEGSESDLKARGHIGSEFIRRSESNVLLEVKDGITTVWGEQMRGIPIFKKDGLMFKWDDEKKMHVTCGGWKNEQIKKLSQGRQEESFANSVEMLKNIFIEKSMLTEQEIRLRLNTVCFKTESNAKTSFIRLRERGLIEHKQSGLYGITDKVISACFAQGTDRNRQGTDRGTDSETHREGGGIIPPPSLNGEGKGITQEEVF